MFTRRTIRVASLFALLALCGVAHAQIKPAHQTLGSPQARANREEILRCLMTGATPSWLAGKSSQEIAQRTQKMKDAILGNARGVVKSIVANPSGRPSRAERTILGFLSPSQRARLLKEEAGFQVEKIKYRVNGQPTDKLKITLKRFETKQHNQWGWDEYKTDEAQFGRQMSIYNRVMGPNIIAYMPAGGHSQYVSRGEVFDMWGMSEYSALRANNYQLFPTWLSDKEAARVKQLAELANKSWGSLLGTQKAHGRPGMWPPSPDQKGKTGNSCTTTFIRAPIGEREPQYAWIDELQAKVGAAARAGRLSRAGVDLARQSLLEAVTGKSPGQYGSIFDAIKAAMPRAGRELDKLRAEVDFFHGKLKGRADPYAYRAREKCVFPMDLMHRAPLSKLANIQGDPVGPGMARQKFKAADATRVGVMTVFEKRPGS